MGAANPAWFIGVAIGTDASAVCVVHLLPLL
jgi:hypothetical protein